jgi:ribosomal protein S21
MVVITKKKGDTKDAVFRKFTKAFIEEDVVTDVRSRMFYKKPSLVRKEEEKLRGKGGGRRKPVLKRRTK